jgi:hypothetical protein
MYKTMNEFLVFGAVEMHHKLLKEQDACSQADCTSLVQISFCSNTGSVGPQVEHAYRHMG